MQFNPKIGFVLGILVTIEIAVSSGTLSLTHAVPPAWIPTVTAWSGILAFVGSTLLTFLHGYSSGDVGPLVTRPPLDLDGARSAASLQPAIQTAAAQPSNGSGASRPGSNGSASRLSIVVLLAAGLGLLLVAPARAQTSRPKPTGNPIVDIGNAIKGQQQQAAVAQNESTEDLVGKLGKLALPDFEFALALSKATNNVVSTPCWQAWVDLLSAQEKPLTDASGTAVTEPSPHLATDVERISELLGALRPDSTLSTGCAALAAAGGKDAATLIQGILSGGALGLFKLPVPLGPIP
jgi:hypothetical protein